MQVGIAIEPLDEEVHHLLEGALLGLGIVRPEGMVARAPLHHLGDSEEVLETVLADKRVAFHVEEQVGGRRLGQRLESRGARPSGASTSIVQLVGRPYARPGAWPVAVAGRELPH